jgi:hypothetical protein
MNYQRFRKKIKDFPVFSSSHLTTFPGNLQGLRNQLYLWQKKGLVIKLKRGLYVLNKDDRKINPSRVFIASQLVSPSYISTQYALSHYGLIPERVADITSITTRKTAAFENEFGTFVYQHLKLNCFTGFIEEKDENGFSYFIAEPEKAFVDFFYLSLGAFSEEDLLVFERSYRFRKDPKIRPKKLRYYAGIFKNKKLLKITENFCRYLRI